MKKYYVSFSGETFVEAEDMNHAVEIAMETVRNDVEATVYDVAENGDIGRKARG